jgi:alkylation response protein AidB-like acyl-CoA dehydrogenase
MIGPTIITHGTEEQKARYLGPILSAQEIWCQGFSEPEAGSDLASVRTRAVRDGVGWRLSGQKVWTSLAHRARWSMILARTGGEDDLPGRRLTMFVMEMDQPGVVIRPLRQLTGDAEFSELFLEDAYVPDENVLGPVGEGWRVAITTLMHERATLSFGLQADLNVAFQELLDLARSTPHDGDPAIDDPLVRERLARLRIELEVMRLTAYRELARTIETGAPGPGGSLGKWQWADINQEMMGLALELLGPTAAVEGDAWIYRYLRSRANSIEGGTSEILKNILAERVLGLPRARMVA